MTGDDFRDRYQILKRLTEGETSTFLARAADGDRVMVHVLPADPAEARDVLARVAALPDPHDDRVRDVERHRGVDVVVTDFLEGVESLAEWLTRCHGGADVEEDGAAEDAAEPGEFTRLFRQRSGEDAAERDVSEDEAEEQQPAAGREEGMEEPAEAAGAPERPDDGAPGEFTRLFEAHGPEEEGEGAAEEEGKPPSEEEAGSDAAAPADADSGPGEFTRMFDAEEDGTTGPAAGAEREGSGADEREDRPDGAAAPEKGGDAPGEEPEEDDGEGPGEFTRMFGSPDTPSDDRPGSAGPRRGGGGEQPSSADDSDDYRKRLGRTGGEESGTGEPTAGGGLGAAGSQPADPERDESGSEEGTSDGPGRYTRMMEEPASGGGESSGSSLATPSTRSAATPASGPGDAGGAAASGDDSGSGSRTVYVVALAGILLAAVALVLVLVLWGGGSGEPDAPSPASDAAEQSRKSVLPGKHHQELQLRIREVGGDVDGEVPRLADGGPVLA